MFDAVTVGGTVQDIIFITKEGKTISNYNDPLCQKLIGFEEGAKIYSKEVYFTSGGGAANLAVGLSRFGVKTSILSRLGKDDIGKTIISNLKKEGVDTSNLQLDSHLSTGISFIVSFPKSPKQVIFSYRGANDKLKVPTQKISTRWFVVSSLSFSHWTNILDYIISQKCEILWNPGISQIRIPFSVFSKYLKQIMIFVVNEDEAREIVFRKNKIKKISLKEVIKQIYSLGPKIVVVTQGKNGATAFDGKNFYFKKAKKTNIINVTGAGDAFNSGFLAYYMKYASINKALEGGILNSAAVISQIGAQKGLFKIN